MLDPFCGRGTTPTCALELGRRTIASDVNDVAICLTKAKTNAPHYSALLRRIAKLQQNFDARSYRHEAEATPPFFHACFARKTLQQLIYLRHTLNWRNHRTDTMIAALVLGSLHGEMKNSSSYLSNQMPRTISTKPAYSLRFWEKHNLYAPKRDVFDLLRSRAAFRYESSPFRGEAQIHHCDMRMLPFTKNSTSSPIRCVVTSPPYLDTTNFEEDQWLRLWFLGGPPHPSSGRLSRDDRHVDAAKYWRFIGDMWRVLGHVVGAKGYVVIRIGSSRVSPDDAAAGIVNTSIFANRKIELIEMEMSEIGKRQTDAFHPGTKGCRAEVDCIFRFAN